MEVSKKLLYGADSVEPNSVYFSINKPYNIVALNLDNCTAVRFEQAITELAPMPTSTECLCVYNISKPDILGFVPLKCESCNEEDGYVQITADNPSIILEFPQNTPLRAYFVNRYTGERLDKPEDLVLLKTQKVSIMATLNVSAEPRTPSAIGCAPFCPPKADWAVDCNTMGWTEIPDCYPEEMFEKIEDCGTVTAINVDAEGNVTSDKEDPKFVGYLLKEPKWWANMPVRDCCGELIGYGMVNEAQDCPPCCTTPVQITMTQPPVIPCDTVYVIGNPDYEAGSSEQDLLDEIIAKAGEQTEYADTAPEEVKELAGDAGADDVMFIVKREDGPAVAKTMQQLLADETLNICVAKRYKVTPIKPTLCGDRESILDLTSPLIDEAKENPFDHFGTKRTVSFANGFSVNTRYNNNDRTFSMLTFDETVDLYNSIIVPNVQEFLLASIGKTEFEAFRSNAYHNFISRTVDACVNFVTGKGKTISESEVQSHLIYDILYSFEYNFTTVPIIVTVSTDDGTAFGEYLRNRVDYWDRGLLTGVFVWSELNVQGLEDAPILVPISDRDELCGYWGYTAETQECVYVIAIT